MGSRARQLQPVGAHLQALQPVGGDGAPVADMLVDEFSMAGANLLLPKAAMPPGAGGAGGAGGGGGGGGGGVAGSEPLKPYLA